MARRGRPAKQGKRTKSGQLSRAGVEPSYDKGSEWVQAQRAKFGTHYNTALGRAYAGGLLGGAGSPYGDQAQADDRYMGGKRFARVYNRIIGGETYRCPLDRTPRGSLTELEACEYDARDREWLFAAMDSLDTAGARPWLDQLLTRAHTDVGPYWLDNLLAGGRDPADVMVLKAAIAALEIVAPPKREAGIVSVRWNDAA